ncbi:MAG: pyridoxamine 5'-phosphate oxidase family protein [Planctomycetota bacterium]|nr:pyridoxamine 5'-phosphate oxidase family protein [Planctomycetota bacterium]
MAFRPEEGQSISGVRRSKGAVMEEMTRAEIEALLQHEPLGRLAMAAGDGTPYVIPMPFCWLDEALYLRLPMKGRKGRVLAENDRVCFEVDWSLPDLSNYASILVEGRLVSVHDLAEKRCVQLANERKYCGLRGAARKGHGRKTPLEQLPLSKIVIASLSGRKKESVAGDDSLPGCPYRACSVCDAGGRVRQAQETLRAGFHSSE